MMDEPAVRSLLADYDRDRKASAFRFADASSCGLEKCASLHLESFKIENRVYLVLLDVLK